MKISAQRISLGILLIIIGAVAGGLAGWYIEHQQAESLSAELEDYRQREAEYQRREVRSDIDRRVSMQMEQIAYQQMAISDEQREEAQQQTRVANEMRERSEIERQNALAAESNALQSERKAREAQSVAEDERRDAEHARNIADTLRYQALARSLASIASNKYDSGDSQTALQLAYVSWLFTSKYDGDLHNRELLQAMMKVSETKHSWTVFNGAITDIDPIKGEGEKMLALSSYGEISIVTKNGASVSQQRVMANNAYDFRDGFVESRTGTVFALSRSGHIVISEPGYNRVSIVVLKDFINPRYLKRMPDDCSLIVGDNSIAIFDPKTRTITAQRQLDYNIVMARSRNSMPLLFDDQGRMHSVKTIDDITTEKMPVRGTVTAYERNEELNIEAYGMSDGSIYFVDAQGKINRFTGHKSRVSKLKFRDELLFSSSFDGTLNFWNTQSEKVEPITILNNSAWLTNFKFDKTNDYALVCDYSGRIIEVPVSLGEMVGLVKQRLKRNMTREEWAFYIGDNVPYETFIGKEATR